MKILGVSFDAQARARAFAEKHALPFPLLSDMKREVAVAFGAADDPKERSARRVSFMIDPQGRIEKVYDTVEPEGHPSEVIDSLFA